MNVQSIQLVYFSPTGTTKRIVEEIAAGLGAENIAVVDGTNPATRSQKPPLFHDELVILGAPVYGGRIPLEAADYFNTLRAENTPAVLVAVYGNRDYEFALKELYDIAVNMGCTPVAGGSFIGEHSYSTERFPIAHGRPDADDLQKAHEFGANIREKLLQADRLDELERLQIPGDSAYQHRKHMQKTMPKFAPKTREKLCTRCGKCAKACPTAAISQEDLLNTVKQQCIACFACIKTCPSGARKMRNILMRMVPILLHLFCRARKEPEMFL